MHLFHLKKTDMVPARVVLYMLSFSGFVVSFMMRMDINIAIVSMVKYQAANNSNISITTTCYSTPNSTFQEFDDDGSKVLYFFFSVSSLIHLIQIRYFLRFQII